MMRRLKYYLLSDLTRSYAYYRASRLVRCRQTITILITSARWRGTREWCEGDRLMLLSKHQSNPFLEPHVTPRYSDILNIAI
jgi:hypothetical protein